MKKTKGLAVIMLLLICFMAFVACDGVVSPIKSVTLTKLPTKVVYNIGEKFDPTGGQITAVMTKNDEVVVVDITADMCGEVDTTKAGKVDVKIGYLEKSVTFQITVVDPSVKTKSIEVTTKPTKVGYLIGEKFSAAGGKLTVTKTDDTKEIIDLTDAMCGTVSTATAGKVAVTVTYQEKTTTFEITVAAPTVSSIAVSANPTKVEYIAGVAFSAVGGKITVSYSNGDIKVVDMTDEMCGTVDTSKVGKVAVTVTYETKTATFDITVVTPTVSSIAVSANPSKVSYFVGETFSAVGGKITATMTYGADQIIDMTDAMCGSVSTASAGTVTVTVTYAGKTATFDITVVTPAVSSIAVSANPTKVSYFVGETFSAVGGKITATMTYGAAQIIDMTDAMCGSVSTASAGTVTVTVTYETKTTTFDITVVTPTVSSIAVSANPTKVSYFVGETFSAAGGKITATMTYGAAQIIDMTDAMCGTVSTASAGKVTVTVTYETKTATFDITVVAPAVSSIAVTTSPTKVSYFVGETFSAAGGKITATMTYGAAQIIDMTDAMCGSVSTASAGTVTVTVTYETKTATFDITVVAPAVSSIAVTTSPTKVSYFVGETFSAAGGKITATMTYGAAQIIDMTDAMCGTVSTASAGKVTVTVTYETKTTTFDITVVTPTVSSIAVSANPSKVSYFVGETFSALGGKITVTMTDTTTNVIDLTDAMCGTVSTATAGKVTVTVTYAGKTATFDITVVNKIAPTIANAPTASTAVTYGDALPAITGEAKDGANIVAGAFTLDAGQTLTVANSTYNYTFAPTDTAKYSTVKGTATITVVAKALTITGVTATNRVYDGTTVVTLAGGTLAGKVGTDEVSFTLGAGSVANANAETAKVVTYTATLTGTAAGNYTVTSNEVKVNITKADYVMTGVTFVNASKVYNGEVQTLAIGGTSLPTGVTVEYTAGITNVGSKVITATFTGDATNYNAIEVKTATLTITPKALTITGVTATNRVYDGTTVVTVTGGTLAGKIATDDVSFTLGAGSVANANAETAKVVTYTATLTGTAAGNYTVTSNEVKVNITKADYVMTGVTFVNASKVYNGEVQTLAIGGTSLPTGVTVEYTAGIKDVGSKVITATFTGDAINYNAIPDMTAGLNITKKPLTITGVTAIDRAYDGTTVVTLVPGTLNGAIKYDEVDYKLSEGSIVSADMGNDKVVTYTATLINREKDNYTVTSNVVTVNITAKAVAVVWGTTQLPYTANAIAPTATVATGIVGETIALTVAGQKTAIGTGYTATATMTTANANYTLTNTTVAYAIVESELSKAEALAEAKVTEIGKLDTAKATYTQANYSSANWTTITGYYDTAKSGINAVTVITSLPGNFVTTFTTNAGAVKTTAQETAEALATAKVTEIGKLDTAKATYTQANYSSANWTTITGYYDTAKSGINAVTVITSLPGNFVTTFTTNAGAVKTTVQETAEALATAKATEIGKLDTAKATYKQADYSSANWTTITGYYDTAVSGINAVTVITSLPGNFVTTFTTNAGAVKTTAQETAEANAVIAKITQLPENSMLTIANKADVVAARADYDALSADAKAKVTNYAILTAAEKQMIVLVNVQEIADAYETATGKGTTYGPLGYTYDDGSPIINNATGQPLSVTWEYELLDFTKFAADEVSYTELNFILYAYDKNVVVKINVIDGNTPKIGFIAIGNSTFCSDYTANETPKHMGNCYYGIANEAQINIEYEVNYAAGTENTYATGENGVTYSYTLIDKTIGLEPVAYKFANKSTFIYAANTSLTLKPTMNNAVLVLNEMNASNQPCKLYIAIGNAKFVEAYARLEKAKNQGNMYETLTNVAVSEVYNAIKELKPVEQLTIADRTTIADIRTKYDALNATFQGLVTNYATLTAAEAKVSKAEALEAAKATEIAKLDTAKATYTQANYSSANWTTITGYYDTAKNGINAVTVITNLPGNFVTTFTTSAGAVKTADQEAAILYTFTPINNGAAYSLKKNAGATLPANITLPATYNGLLVTDIAASAFNGCTELTTVAISSSITSIGKMAFYDCKNLATITIPSSVTSVGKWAFDGTAWLKNQPAGVVYINNVLYVYSGTMPSNTTIEVRSGTVEIATNAFSSRTGLVSITIPGSVKSIGNDAFNGCNALTTVTMQNGVASIGSRAFTGCTALTNINIPASVTSIVNNPFMNCINLATITVDGANATYKSVGNCVIEKASKTLVIGCKASVIPADGSVTCIGTSAFDGCENLTAITIPSTVTSIGDYAFKSCIGLTTIAIPNGVISIGKSAFTMCSQLATVTIALSVQTIGSEAFSNCSALTTITCEAANKPSGWDAQWNTTTATVVYKKAQQKQQ